MSVHNNAVFAYAKDCYLRYAEKKLADYVGVKYVSLTSMGRAALVIALKALEVGPGCDVVLPSFTCRTLVEAIQYCKARAVFADVDPLTFNIDPQQIKKSITPKTRAVITIHCYGLPSDIDEILEVAEKYDIPLIEDVAHALGAKYRHRKVGSFGDFSFFSFSKNMGASTGGALATNSQELAEKVREVLSEISKVGEKAHKKLPVQHRLLSFGRKRRLFFLRILSSLKLLKYATKFLASTTEDIPPIFDVNSAVAAEIARKLEKMDEINSKRIEEARILTRILENLDMDSICLPIEKSNRKNVYYLYPVRVFDSRKFQPKLQKLKRYVYWKSPWKCPYSIEAQKLSEQLILLDMKPTLLTGHPML
jgi:dTDP-4-amino-4,6-dideoxygalactose transaminase